ncbi:hypothetical protein Taro_022538 [Colocasia esculenta]|uniref:Disease resistance protein winged helix domain-containing protein n=1 Tax=Colocasia esculenta TaxID=4460 RepID=A0A843V253_COLES|nr:hypothetical protein [Colocasia esculenta]
MPPASTVLKKCFTFYALFPPGHQFDRDELFKLWIAQGYIDQNPECLKYEMPDLLHEGESRIAMVQPLPDDLFAKLTHLRVLDLGTLTSISSYASSLPCFAASSPRRCRFSIQLHRPGRGAGHCRRRPSRAVTMCFGGWNRPGRDFGGELVDENMAVLRKRIHDVRMTEKGDGGPPAHWMEWEKRHHGCYTAVACNAVAMLQGLLLNTRPSVALGVAALLAMSVPTSAIMVVLNLVGGH